MARSLVLNRSPDSVSVQCCRDILTKKPMHRVQSGTKTRNNELLNPRTPTLPKCLDDKIFHNQNWGQSSTTSMRINLILKIGETLPEPKKHTLVQDPFVSRYVLHLFVCTCLVELALGHSHVKLSFLHKIKPVRTHMDPTALNCAVFDARILQTFFTRCAFFNRYSTSTPVGNVNGK